jgi:hypothetical protein
MDGSKRRLIHEDDDELDDELEMASVILIGQSWFMIRGEGMSCQPLHPSPSLDVTATIPAPSAIDPQAFVAFGSSP